MVVHCPDRSPKYPWVSGRCPKSRSSVQLQLVTLSHNHSLNPNQNSGLDPIDPGLVFNQNLVTFQKQPTQPWPSRELQLSTSVNNKDFTLCLKKMFWNLIPFSLVSQNPCFCVSQKLLMMNILLRKLLIPISIDSPHIWSVFDCEGTCWM